MRLEEPLASTETTLRLFGDKLLEKLEAELAQGLVDHFKSYKKSYTYSKYSYGPFGMRSFTCRSQTKHSFDVSSATNWFIRTQIQRKWWKDAIHAIQNIESKWSPDSSLLYSYARELIEARLSNRNLVSVHKRFMRRYLGYLAGKPGKALVICPLYGCYLQESLTLKIEGVSIRLRPPSAKDLSEYSLPQTMYSLGDGLTTGVLTVEGSAKNIGIDSWVPFVWYLLILYKPGSLSYGDIRITADNFGGNVGYIGRSGMSKSRSRMFLRFGLNDAERILAFARLFTSSRISQFSSKPASDIGIGLNAYIHAIHDWSTVERQIAESVIALEALLMGDSNSDLAFRAACRTAKIASCLGYEAIRTRDLVQSAYKVRSTQVHGSQLSDKESRKIYGRFGGVAHFAQDIVDVTRSVLVARMGVDMNKALLIDLVDRSFIDNQEDVRLRDLLSPIAKVCAPLSLKQPFYDHVDPYANRVDDEE